MYFAMIISAASTFVAIVMSYVTPPPEHKYVSIKVVQQTCKGAYECLDGFDRLSQFDLV